MGFMFGLLLGAIGLGGAISEEAKLAEKRRRWDERNELLHGGTNRDLENKLAVKYRSKDDAIARLLDKKAMEIYPYPRQYDLRDSYRRVVRVIWALQDAGYRPYYYGTMLHKEPVVNEFFGHLDANLGEDAFPYAGEFDPLVDAANKHRLTQFSKGMCKDCIHCKRIENQQNLINEYWEKGRCDILHRDVFMYNEEECCEKGE